MELNQNQTKFVELTMKLDLKTREYQKLCEEFDRIKKITDNPNDEQFAILLAQFEQNNQEIEAINKEFTKLNFLKKN